MNLNKENNDIQVLSKRTTFDSSKRYKESKRPFIESHRGCVHQNELEKENTIAAFTKAIKIGCDSIEIDVWLSCDKIPIVIHGSEKGEIHETSNGRGLINHLTYLEISRLRTKGSDPQPIPTLGEVFSLCKDKIFLNIEIKDENYTECFEVILNEIHRHQFKSQCAISSFNHKYWEEIKKSNEVDKIEFGFLFYSNEHIDISFDPEKRNSTLNLYYKDITEEFVKKAHQNNFGVHVWFENEDQESEEIFEILFNCGVDVVCTNSPMMAMKIRDKLYEVKVSNVVI